jgi:NADH:ubiquinone oxidoreductase subunit C
MLNHSKNYAENSELAVLSNTALRNLVVAGFKKTDETLHFTTYRQSLPALAAYLKLSSLFNANNPIDCYATDRIDAKFRFTVVYTVQSTGKNNTVQLVTKTNGTLPLLSLQDIYPAFN